MSSFKSDINTVEIQYGSNSNSPESLGLANIQIRGELAYRSIKNYSRLEGRWYRPFEVFDADQHGWPGDWEGRLILALTLLAQATHRYPAYLEEIIDNVPLHLNCKGYFGSIPPKGVINEQQIGGHSWFLRGLIEYYRWTDRKDILEMIDTLVGNLLLSAKGFYSKYPLTKKDRLNCKHWHLSHLQSKTATHSKTSDAGCGFIMSDGATQAYELLGLPELKELILEMFERFMQIEPEAVNLQTHATLTTVRAMLRYYEIEKDTRILGYAKKVFDSYKKYAWTENYANYNWWGTPRWTESCAVIDSFIAAVWLWKNTGNSQYLHDAHHIYYNAIAFGQRDNGGFGTDYCVGTKDVFLRPLTYEAYWCCSMRGGEGFAKAIEYNYFVNQDEIILVFYNDSIVKISTNQGELLLEQKTSCPYEGKVKLKVLSSTIKSSIKMKFFAPSWSKKDSIVIHKNGLNIESIFTDDFLIITTKVMEGDVFSFDMGISLHFEDAVNKNNLDGYHSIRKGALILGYQTDKELQLNAPEFEILDRGYCRVKGSDIILSPIHDVTNLTRENSSKQILFRN